MSHNRGGKNLGRFKKKKAHFADFYDNIRMIKRTTLTNNDLVALVEPPAPAHFPHCGISKDLIFIRILLSQEFLCTTSLLLMCYPKSEYSCFSQM